MDIIVKRRGTGSPPPQPKAVQPSPSARHIGEWGTVAALHSEDTTVDILLASGVFLNHVPVASREWVIAGEDAGKDYNTGERNLPPVYARVFVLMPTGTYNDCFVAPFSGFSTIDQTSPFMAADQETFQERITPSGWHSIDDNRTGSHSLVSPDGKTSLEINYGTEEEPKADAPELHLSLFDQIKADVIAEDTVTLSVFEELALEHVKGESCTITVFDTEFSIKPGMVSLKPKQTTIEVDGDVLLKTSGKTTIEAAGDALVKGETVTLAAAAQLTLETGDAAAWMPNCIPQCPLGPVHGGNPAGIIKLCGR